MDTKTVQTVESIVNRFTNPHADRTVFDIFSGIVLSKWQDRFDKKSNRIVDALIRILYEVASINHIIENESARLLKTYTGDSFVACDVYSCLSLQMAQPYSFDEYARPEPIDYEHDSHPQIPIGYDGLPIGPAVEETITICLDCFYDATRRQTLLLEPAIMDDIIYTIIGKLVPERIRQVVIRDNRDYPEFTEKSSPADLTRLLFALSMPDYLYRLLEDTMPIPASGAQKRSREETSENPEQPASKRSR
jgi:hypothetical protein